MEWRPGQARSAERCTITCVCMILQTDLPWSLIQPLILAAIVVLLVHSNRAYHSNLRMHDILQLMLQNVPNVVSSGTFPMFSFDKGCGKY